LSFVKVEPAKLMATEGHLLGILFSRASGLHIHYAEFWRIRDYYGDWLLILPPWWKIKKSTYDMLPASKHDLGLKY
jgi:hypothetical protein